MGNAVSYLREPAGALAAPTAHVLCAHTTAPSEDQCDAIEIEHPTKLEDSVISTCRRVVQNIAEEPTVLLLHGLDHLPRPDE